MFVILTSIGAGKTYNALKWLRGTSDTYLLVPTEFQKEQILKKDPALECRIIPWIAYEAGALKGKKISAIGIDNLEAILRLLFHGQNIGLVTMTIDNDNVLFDWRSENARSKSRNL
jgi:hypothetical protein